MLDEKRHCYMAGTAQLTVSATAGSVIGMSMIGERTSLRKTGMAQSSHVNVTGKD